MNSPGLIDQLQEDYLRCKICFQPFQLPKALPVCLHTYCENCLRGYIYSRSYDTAGKFPCPECRREVVIPEGGVSKFPDNHMVVSLQDTVTQQGGSAPVSPTAPPPPPVNNTTNNLNLNLNYQGTINVDNTHNQERTTPTNQARGRQAGTEGGGDCQQSDTRGGNCQQPAVGTRRMGRSTTSPALTPTRPAPRPGTGTVSRCTGTVRSASSVSVASPPQPTGRLYPVLPTSAELNPPPEPVRIRPTRPAPPPPPPPVSLPPASVPIVYNRHGAILCFGKHGDGLSDFTHPVGMILSPHGCVIISDRRDNRIIMLELYGKLRSILTTNGRIQDIAVDSKGNIVCANTKIANALAVAYDMNGKIVRTYGNHYTYEKPHGIAVTRSDSIIVSTLETKIMYRLGEDGQMLQKFKAKSREGQGLNKPLYVATNYAEDMIVSDEGNHCVRVFTKVGALKFQIGGKPSHKLGALRHPRGVCTDHHGNIIVADSGNHRVQMYDSSGKFMDVLVEIKRESPGCEIKPQNVAVQGDKMVVMVVGPQFAQIRVYSYHPDVTKHQACACQ